MQRAPIKCWWKNTTSMMNTKDYQKWKYLHWKRWVLVVESSCHFSSLYESNWRFTTVKNSNFIWKHCFHCDGTPVNQWAQHSIRYEVKFFSKREKERKRTQFFEKIFPWQLLKRLAKTSKLWLNKSYIIY